MKRLTQLLQSLPQSSIEMIKIVAIASILWPKIDYSFLFSDMNSERRFGPFKLFHCEMCWISIIYSECFLDSSLTRGMVLLIQARLSSVSDKYSHNLVKQAKNEAFKPYRHVCIIYCLFLPFFPPSFFSQQVHFPDVMLIQLFVK